ncbi:heparinase II/III family protein [Camelimonas abortus]|uniref:Heparinase II/III family protein n=1 Tax=Camelimonas abortus TaxID=1017184 RepID=A0ABV7LCX3_9HYPH
MRLYALLAREGLRCALSLARALVLRLFPAPVRAPEQLLVAPQDLRTADPTLAADYYAGFFAFAGRVVETRGESPFAVTPPSQAWDEELCGFSWLRHLRAANTDIARAHARSLVEDFLEHDGDRRGAGAAPRVAARRLISFLSQTPLLLEGADQNFYSRFMRTIGRSVAQLRAAAGPDVTADDRLLIAIAQCFAGLCLGAPPRAQARSDAALSALLNRHVLQDGGHVSRNPRRLIELLADLLPLRQTYTARGLEPPMALITAIDRMMPMLRLFRHDDGSIALFNGMGASEPDLLATILAYDDTHARPMTHAPWSGYERVAAGRALLIADVGAPPPRPFSAEAHAGCLSFEFSCAGSALVVNCGASPVDAPAARLAARSTAAHSTVTVADSSSCRFAGAPQGDWLAAAIERLVGPLVLCGPTQVRAERSGDAAGFRLAASHDGYLSRYGVIHERRFWLPAAGDGLHGVDRLERSGGGEVSAVIRFHLHPSVQATPDPDGQAVSLVTPDGQHWRFEAPGHVTHIDESVWFAAPGGPRPSRQLVIDMLVPENVAFTEISWRFTRVAWERPDVMEDLPAE